MEDERQNMYTIYPAVYKIPSILLLEKGFYQEDIISLDRRRYGRFNLHGLIIWN